MKSVVSPPDISKAKSKLSHNVSQTELDEDEDDEEEEEDVVDEEEEEDDEEEDAEEDGAISKMNPCLS